MDTGMLNQQIDQTRQLIRKSFFSSLTTSLEEEFNFDCYIHFRVYNEILNKREVIFQPFWKEYERTIGTSILQYYAMQEQYPRLLIAQQSSSSSSIAQCLINALSVTDAIATLLQTKGLITSWERSIPLEDDIEDFVDEDCVTSMDLTYSLAMNGDITLNSQLLLQELGYRLYPSFGRWMVNEAILRCFVPHTAYCTICQWEWCDCTGL